MQTHTNFGAINCIYMSSIKALISLYTDNYKLISLYVVILHFLKLYTVEPQYI